MTVMVGLVLSGCRSQDDLPAAGADAPVVMWRWDKAAQQHGQPWYIRAASIAQTDGALKKLMFQEPWVRVPDGAGGVVYLRAPQATYAQGDAETLVLGARGEQPLDGPVRFCGRVNGVLFQGRAARAVMSERHEQQAASLYLTEVELISAQAAQHFAFVRLYPDNQQWETGPVRQLGDSPAVLASMAALPNQVPLPPPAP